MDPLSIALNAVALAAKYGPTVVQMFNVATSNETFWEKVEDELPAVGSFVKGVTATVAPASSPAVNNAIGTVMLFNKKLMEYGQAAVNAAAKAGLIKIAAPLEVDGDWGPLSRAAFKQLQIFMKLSNIDGMIGKVSQAAIAKLGLTGLPSLV